MKMIWSNLGEFFEFLNENFEYAVLRNWEQYSTEQYFSEEDDIDILCRDKAKFVDAIGGIQLYHRFNRCNYCVEIGNDNIKIDIRYIGDGYYCKQWEERLLERRIFSEKGFYVLNSEDYFYSLLYHVLVQKPKLSPAYYDKLKTMTDDERQFHSEEELLLMLHDYMEGNNFYIEYPSDCAVFLNRKNIHDGKLTIKRNITRKLLRKIYRIHSRVFRRLSRLARLRN